MYIKLNKNRTPYNPYTNAIYMNMSGFADGKYHYSDRIATEEGRLYGVLHRMARICILN